MFFLNASVSLEGCARREYRWTRGGWRGWPKRRPCRPGRTPARPLSSPGIDWGCQDIKRLLYEPAPVWPIMAKYHKRTERVGPGGDRVDQAKHQPDLCPFLRLMHAPAPVQLIITGCQRRMDVNWFTGYRTVRLWSGQWLHECYYDSCWIWKCFYV